MLIAVTLPTSQSFYFIEYFTAREKGEMTSLNQPTRTRENIIRPHHDQAC